MNVTDLEYLMGLVAENWSFDEKNYPRMQGLSGEERKVFALRHILMHQAKAMAKLTEVVEPIDHGGSLDREKLWVAARNFLVNTLQLASVAGMEPRELGAGVQVWASELHRP